MMRTSLLVIGHLCVLVGMFGLAIPAMVSAPSDVLPVVGIVLGVVLALYYLCGLWKAVSRWIDKETK